MKKLISQIERSYTLADAECFFNALNQIKQAQTKSSNQHKFSVALKKGIEASNLLIKTKIDINTILASLLFNLVKEELIQLEDFDLNTEVKVLIKDTNFFEDFQYNGDKEDTEKLRAMFVNAVKDIRTLILKLANVTVTAVNRETDERNEFFDRLHIEIKEIYAPLAARLGLSFIKSTLQDENFKYLEPENYKKLEKALNKEALTREIALNKTIKHLKTMLNNLKIEGQVYGRLKHISSIQKKLVKKARGSLNNIFDLVAVRIIVEDVQSCYAVLGHVHTIYNPVENLFKDYIAKPKPNGYKSLHTTVYVENNQIVEVQIRTQEMHDFAEYGVAAHWLYKEDGKKRQSNIDKKLTWIRQIIENTDSLSASEIKDELKTNDYDSEIYLQTPKGNIIELPAESTPIDFAYSIHSEVGNKCVGAKVNGKMVPLSTELKNGEIVEIITSTNSKGPSRDWLKFVKSVSAKNKINAYFKKERKDENIKRGKVILEQSAKAKKIALHKMLEDKYLTIVFDRYSLKNMDDLYAAIGHGSLTAVQILTKLTRVYNELNKPDKSNNTVIKNTVGTKVNLINNKDVVVIKGLNNLLTRFAKCCTPIPGDDVIAYVSRGKGATIHRSTCKMLQQLEPERLIKAEWGDIENNSYQAELKLVIKNASGILAGVTNKIAELNINIVSITTNHISQEKSLLTLFINVQEKQELETVINKLKTLKTVYKVYRN